MINNLLENKPVEPIFDLASLTDKRNKLTELENEYMMKKEIIEVDRAKMQSMVDIPSLGDVVKTALAVEVKKKDHEMSGLRSTYLRQIEIGTEDMVEMAAVNNKNLVVGFDTFLNNISEVHAGLLLKATDDRDTADTHETQKGVPTLGSPSLASPSLAASTSSSLTMQGGAPFPIAAAGLPFAMAYHYNASVTGASSVSSGYEPPQLQPDGYGPIRPKKTKTYMDILEENTKTNQASLFKSIGVLSEKTLLTAEGSKQIKEFRPDIVSVALTYERRTNCLSFPYAEYKF